MADDSSHSELSGPGYLAFCRGRGAERWLGTEPEYMLWPELDLAARAEKAMRHHFREPYYPNAPEYELGAPIDWRRTPFPPGHPEFSSATISSVSRHLWWRDLADAYQETGDERYAMEWAAQLTAWIAECPPVEPPDIWEPGEIWRGLNAGIRMFDSWPHAYFAFLGSTAMTPALHDAWCDSVRRHGHDLHAMTVGCPQQTGNWVGMQCRGLATIALLFPEWPESDGWFSTAAARLASELEREIHPDGGQKELCPAYHHVAYRDFFETLRLAEHNGRAMPGNFRTGMERMFRWMERMASPDGHLPPLGDSPRLDITATLRQGECFWGKSVEVPAMSPFPDSGYFVFDSPGIHAVFDAGPLGNGHWHEDCLSLYLEAYGKPLLTDPGKYNYDASVWRYYAVGTTAHNTLTVDGKWQRRGAARGATGPFADVCHAHSVHRGAGWIRVTGVYHGPYRTVRYAAVPYYPCEEAGEEETSVIHTRHVIFIPEWEIFVIVDECAAPSDRARLFETRWHLDAAEAEIRGDGSCLATRADGSGIVIQPVSKPFPQLRLDRGVTDPSPLGWLPFEDPARPIPVLTIGSLTCGPAAFACLLLPFRNHGSLPEIHAEFDPEGRKLSLHSPSGRVHAKF